MRRGVALALMLLAGCDRRSEPVIASSAGSRLEAAATSAGLVPDVKASIQGSWARDTDRVCILDRADGKTAIGATIDYGEGQQCAASGTVKRSGQTLDVRFGDCRLKARFEGDRIAFPASVPEACESLCTGRASLAALTVDRLSESRSEAATLRSPRGKLLCDG